MGCSTFLLLALFSIVVQLQFSLSTAQTFVQLADFNNCNNNTFDATLDYKRKSSYDVNLQLLLSYISNNTGNSSRFYAGAVGRAPDTVYGVFQCRADLEPQDCKKCAETAVGDIAVRCPNNKEMSVWYDECFLRYSNKHRVGSLADATNNCFPWANNVSNPIMFRSKLYELMNGLVVQAANNVTSKFAIDVKNVTNSQKIYGLVQCSQDLSGRDCARCLNQSITEIANCSDGKDGGRILQPSCILWYEVYKFFESDPLPSLLPPSKTTDVTKGNGHGSSSKNIFIIVFATVAVISILFIIVIIGFVRNSRSYDPAKEGVSTIESLRFTLERLIAATDNFSESNKLGEGGFGVVYKGRMNEHNIAVKRLAKNSTQGVEEFKNEVLLLAKLEHKNLVRLLGFCLEGNEKLLIYEFIENSSLDHFIFDPIKSMILDWERRYNIIQGIARGLLYLHEDSPQIIIHRDLKASNIFLDAKMNPKITDFGQARLFGVDQTQGKTSQIVGTQGYMSPEYLLHGHFSVKSDVFSFGVLVLEIIAGQRNRDAKHAEDGQDLLNNAWRLWEQGTPLELLETTQREHYSRNEVMQCIQMGLLCVQEDVAKRPTMTTIVLMLNSYSFTLPTPSAPAFYVKPGTRLNTNRTAELSHSPIASVNDVSITELRPR